jgi:hypothetical protein
MAGPTHDHADAAVATPDAIARTDVPERDRHGPAGTSRPSGAVRGQRSASDPSPVDQAPRRDRLTRRRTIALQRSAGNRAVAGMLRRIQRVEVKLPDDPETLYDSTDKRGRATANSYASTVAYEITRQADSGTTVTIKTLFVSQLRGRDGKPRGKESEIPADDERRAFATDVTSKAMVYWNGRVAFVGEETIPPGGAPLPVPGTPAPAGGTTPPAPAGAGTPPAPTAAPAPAATPTPGPAPIGPPHVIAKRLPVTFKNEPVFDLAAAHHARVVIHPRSVTAGTPGNPIDAGNYYVNKGAYEDDQDKITAHEYGHLLGIDDEYSQSNEQLNAALHASAPGNAPSHMAKLDKATVERMVVMSMRAPMVAQLAKAMPQVTAAIRAQREVVTKRMVAAAREGIGDDSVTGQLQDQLSARTATKAEIEAQVPAVIAAQTTSGFDAGAHAAAGIKKVFPVAALTDQMLAIYARRFSEGSTVNLGDQGDVTIDVQSSVTRTTAKGGANAAAAKGLAASNVGKPPAKGGASGAGGGTAALPAITPPATLVDKLIALPADWKDAGSAVEREITPQRFATLVVAVLKAAQVAGAALPPARQAIGSRRRLIQTATTLLTNAARSATSQLASDLVEATTRPTLEGSVDEFREAVRAEVEKVMGTPASGVASLGTPDPNMTAIVAAMKTRLEANKAAAAGGGIDPLNTGGKAPPQDVTYDRLGLMGTKTGVLRPDQFQGVLGQFNGHLKNAQEKAFTTEMT